MAVETDPSRTTLGVVRRLRGAIAVLSTALEPLLVPLRSLGALVHDTWLVRVLTASLRRRIVLSNVFGVAILLIGLFILSQNNVWLIDAKRESLRAQGEIIAQAIAASAEVQGERIMLDPDRLPEPVTSRAPFRDDGFAALEMSMRPERVTPILRKLVEPTDNRVRIYDRDGTLVADSAAILRRGQISSYDGALSEKTGRPKAKNFWTRLTEFFLASDIPVYKEIADGNGLAYFEVQMAMSGGAPSPMLLLTAEGEQIVSVAVPIQRARKVLGVLLLSTEPGEIDKILWEERRNIMMLGLLAIAAALSAAFLLAGTVAGPMRRLSETAENVSRNINARRELPEFPDRQDEVGQMARSFRAMTSALYKRIEASERFAADVAHELKNPLTAARSTAESLSFAKSDAERAQLVGQIQEELKRLNRLISDVSNASRLDAELARQETEPVRIGSLVEGVVSIFRDKAERAGCRLETAIEDAEAEGLVVQGHEGRLAQVLTNVVDNALSFSTAGALVLIRARRADDTVEIVIEDEGPGIPEDKLAAVFDRFYTYRPTAQASRGANSGLGLSISREIIRAHGGEIWAENRYEAREEAARRAARPIGARFTVRLPAKPVATPARRWGHNAAGAPAAAHRRDA